MKKRVKLIFLKTTGREPHLGAAGYGNAMLESYFRDRQFNVDTHARNAHGEQASDSFMPFQHYRVLREVQRSARADLAVYDDFGLYACLPDQVAAKRTLVFFHSLAGGRGVWTSSHAAQIDAFCANSEYLKRVLLSVLALPRLDGEECMHPNPFRAVRTLRLPVVENEELRLSVSADLPEAAARELDAGNILGHAIQPEKPDLLALCAILVHLNATAMEHGSKARYRFFLYQGDLERMRDALRAPPANSAPNDGWHLLAAQLASLRMSVDDLFIGVRWLPRKALFALMRHSRFCIGYNRIPEALGFYFIESVLNGCPVYTNGSGNNRYLVPPGHGITVQETVDMAFGQVEAFREVALNIFNDCMSGARREECKRGAEYLRREWSHSSFVQDMDACLAALDAPVTEKIDARTLSIAMSPLVRAWGQDGRIVSDYVSKTLSANDTLLIRELLGQRWGDVVRLDPQRLAAIEELFLSGILTLSRDAAPSGPTSSDT